MKSKHTIVLMLTLAIITLIFSSCTKEVSYIDDVEDEAPLIIYLWGYNSALEANI